MDFGCAIGSLRDGKFPDKDCLLPLISKLLGYAIVAASTTVKVPQVGSFLHFKSLSYPGIIYLSNLLFIAISDTENFEAQKCERA